MQTLRLIHWKAAEARERAVQLRAAGYRVDAAPLDKARPIAALRAQPSDAFVIDLTRLPSHGREVGQALRMTKSTRHIPLVFVDGEPAKVDRIRKLLPDAVYTTWNAFKGDLRRAIARPPTSPIVPGSPMDAYAGTPLPKKLGVKPGHVVGLDGAPPGFEKILTLPGGAKITRQARACRDLTLWFVRSRRELEKGIRARVPRGANGGLWIVWPKKTSSLASDVGEVEVRRTGLALGLVDYKICAVDATWSGLRFTLRGRL